ncbi:hypothetical protein DI291_0565 [Bacillus paralicheniformis]|nr:hypothetical protein DI291_0565 [Bacillus paralicheniformis]
MNPKMLRQCLQPDVCVYTIFQLFRENVEKYKQNINKIKPFDLTNLRYDHIELDGWEIKSKGDMM